MYALCPLSRVRNNHISILSAISSTSTWHRPQTKVSQSDPAESAERDGFQVLRHATVWQPWILILDGNYLLVQTTEQRRTSREAVLISVPGQCASASLNKDCELHYPVTSVERRRYTEIHIFYKWDLFCLALSIQCSHQPSAANITTEPSQQITSCYKHLTQCPAHPVTIRTRVTDTIKFITLHHATFCSNV